MAGESGCGKSTLASTVLRLQPQRTVTGEVLVRRRGRADHALGRAAGRALGRASIVFQGALHSLNPVHRIGAQIAEPIQVHDPGLGEEKVDARIGELLDQVGLDPARARSYPHQLSGGQKQRVMIAMALACDPELVVADEPTTALDVMVQAQVLDVLSDAGPRTRGRDDDDQPRPLGARRPVRPDHRDVRRPRGRGGTGRADLLRAAAPVLRRPVGGVPAGRRPGGAVLARQASPVTRPTRATSRADARSQPRCPRAAEVCLPAEPELATYDEGRVAACVRIGEPDALREARTRRLTPPMTAG